jgi:hypothetical protein
VCGEPVIEIRELPEELRDKVYNPSVDGEIENSQTTFVKRDSFESEELPEINVDV